MLVENGLSQAQKDAEYESQASALLGEAFVGWVSSGPFGWLG